MKNLYFLAAAFACTTLSAQNVISFDSSEGYQLGDIRGQNSWTVTDDGDGNYISSQVITDEKASSGFYSFKNAYEPEFNPQFFPIIGAQKSLEQPLDFQNGIISFDAFVTESDASNFEMAGYGISSDQEFVPVFDLAFDYNGTFHVVTSSEFDMQDTESPWQPNQWYAIKIVISATEIRYFVNSELIYSTPNFSQVNLEGLNFLHDNFGGDAYIDNIEINEELMAVKTVRKGQIALYPNPVKSNLNFSLPNAEKIAQISVHNLAGQMVVNRLLTDNTANLSDLKPGTYIVTVTNSKGVSYTSKFIKE